MLLKPNTNIIITTWNALDYTKNTIESLFKNTNNAYYLTVVDNGSIDGTEEYLKALDPLPLNCVGYKYILNHENLGPGRAINIGYKSFDTKYTCVANNDVWFGENWLCELESALDSDPDLGIVSPLRPSAFIKHPYSNKSTKDVVISTPIEFTIEEELAFFGHGKSMKEVIVDIIKANGGGIEYFNTPPGYVSTCTALVNNGIIDIIGGMADPIFKTYGTEDIDLSWRIGFSRYKAAWVKSSYVHHFRHKSIQRNELDFKKCVKQNNAIFYEKWRHTIDDLLLQKDYQGNSIYDCMTKEDIEDFWFLRRLNENIHFYSI